MAAGARSSTIRSSAPGTSRSRRTHRTTGSPPRWRRPRRSPAPAARSSRRPNSPSTRSGSTPSERSRTGIAARSRRPALTSTAAGRRRARALALDLLVGTQAARGVPRRSSCSATSSEADSTSSRDRAAEQALEAAAGSDPAGGDSPVARAGARCYRGAGGCASAMRDRARAGRSARRRRPAGGGARRRSRSVASMAGDAGCAVARRRRRIELASAVGRPAAATGVDDQAVVTLVWSCQLDRARALLESHRPRVERARRAVRAPGVFGTCAMVELRPAGSGSPPSTRSGAGRPRASTRSTTARTRPLTWPVALIAAHRGELELARASPNATGAADREPTGRTVLATTAVLGLVELWSGDPGGGSALFAAADAGRRGSGLSEPSMFWWRADHAEALLELGRIDEAVARAGCLGGGRGAARTDVGAGPGGALPRSRRGRPGRRRGSRWPARASSRAARGGRRPVRPRAGAAGARHRQAAGATEARSPRGDRGGARRLRDAAAPRAGRRRPAPSSARSADARGSRA